MSVRTAAALVAAAGLVLDTGCVAYVPVATGVPPAGAEVRLQLTPQGTSELTRHLGPGVTSVDGRLASMQGDSAIVVAATWVQTTDGSRQRWNGEETVAFPRAYLTSIQLRTIDRRRSTVAGVAIAAALITIGVVVMRGGSSSGSSEGPPGSGVFVRR